MQSLGDLSADTLDAAHCLHIQFLGRELDGGITRVDTSELDMLTNGIGKNLTVLCHRIHLYLLGMLNELRNHHRMVLAHIGCQL